MYSAGPALARERGPATPLTAEFEKAAREYGVPVALLQALGYVNTRLEMPPAQTSAYRSGDPEGRGAYGIMALVRNPACDTLGEAARLAGISPRRLSDERAANIMGGAALLASSQGSSAPADPARWLGAVHGAGGSGRRYTATSGVGSGELYAGQVGEVLASGFSITVSSGEKVTLRGRRSR